MKAQIGRLALRDEGEFWVAYFARSQDSMDGAIKLGSIRMSIVRGDRQMKQRFMELMQISYEQAVIDVTGQIPTWGKPTAAPENERGQDGKQNG
jgi:hypothetical protein